jgi:pyruvate formate-lyase activating enzyme-like uncharacterized protein
MSPVEFGAGSACNGRPAKGCEYCARGSKMVLFVTGRCRAGCFYCPVSEKRKGKDVVYADEALAPADDAVIQEAEAINAEGTGITGGDPSENMERTLHFIRLLKEHFGKGHHIHMYTSVISLENAKRLEEAGLDEIRYHPPEAIWHSLDKTELKDITSQTKMDVGIEVPALPGREADIIGMLRTAFDCGADFANLNELEFSETNWGMMESHGYAVKDDITAAVKGSEETARAVMEALPDKRIHYCSSAYKDGVQLRNRLKRRAENTAREYDVVTEDGTFIKGIIYADDLDKAASLLKEKYDVPDELILIDRQRNRIETAPWVLEEIAEELPYRCYETEEYPTDDHLEVERTPLN